MKERPILFNADMVRAILDGRKTQTRRVVKADFDIIGECDDGSLWPWREDCENGGDIWYPCPYGQPGDRLWVRETWAMSGHQRVEYRAAPADGSDFRCVDRWRPSIHMPRWASRITLEITAVRVERLQDISEEDAKAEGVWKYGDEDCWKIYTKTTSFGTSCPRRSFESLWQSINGPDSWNANPWVWVIEFKRVEAPARTEEVGL